MNSRLLTLWLACVLLMAAAGGCGRESAVPDGTALAGQSATASPASSNQAGVSNSTSASMETASAGSRASAAAAGAKGTVQTASAGAGASAPTSAGAAAAAGAGTVSAGAAGGGGSIAAAGSGGQVSVDSAAPKPSAGCTSGTVMSSHTDETIDVGGTRRQYVQTVPSSYDGKTPFAVLLDFHGGTYDGKRWDERASNQYHEMAETEKFIYITPTGLNQWWTTTEGKDGADGKFMQALLDKIKATACVDERRIYATGCSMGGDMSFYMACYFSDQIAASFPLCGSASFNLEQDCKPTRPISLQFIIGSQDTLNCWEPPRTSVGNPCSTEVQAVFQKLNHCMGEPKKTENGVCETLDQCDEGTEVKICMVEAQHTTIYENTDIEIYKDGWNWLKRFYIH